MTATAERHATLTAIGRRVDELAQAGADEQVLDGLLTAMQQIHDSIIEHLTAATTSAPTRRRQGRWGHLHVA